MFQISHDSLACLFKGCPKLPIVIQSSVWRAIQFDIEAIWAKSLEILYKYIYIYVCVCVCVCITVCLWYLVVFLLFIYRWSILIKTLFHCITLRTWTKSGCFAGIQKRTLAQRQLLSSEMLLKTNSTMPSIHSLLETDLTWWEHFLFSVHLFTWCNQNISRLSVLQ